MTVVTFETRRCEASPKVTTVLHFATTTPPIPVTDTFEMRNVKSDDSSTFRDDFRLSGKSDASPKLHERCEPLRTIADDKRNDLASPPGPLDRNFKGNPSATHSGKKPFLGRPLTCSRRHHAAKSVEGYCTSYLLLTRKSWKAP